MDAVETLVIGAGVVGLAIARRLALSGREVVVLEAEDQFGSATSARNSEVIHAGIYYPEGSLKARMCVEGRKKLYAFCASHHIPHDRCGKLIVATRPEEDATLTDIAARARANGVDDIALIPATEATAMEPALSCTAALHSPSTGIIDSHALMVALLGEAEEHGAMLALSTPATRIHHDERGFIVEAGGASPLKLRACEVINTAGHGAPALSTTLTDIAGDVPTAYFAKGNYFTLTGKAPFARLIYPAPVSGGLGVHLTLDMTGQARFGPDVEWLETLDYSVDPGRGAAFYGAIRRYWPTLAEGSLAPGYAGIRPKIAGPGAPPADFRIETHGTKGYVALYGIESPGLTACLALAEHVLESL